MDPIFGKRCLDDPQRVVEIESELDLLGQVEWRR